MKRTIALLLAAALCALAGCGAQDGGGHDPSALGEAMYAAAEGLPAMAVVENDAELFRYVSDLDYGLVEGYYLAYAEGGSAEELAVITVKDAADVKDARASLERHLADRLGLFRVYDPDEASAIESASIAVDGDTVALAVCDNAEAVTALIKQ